MPWSSVSEDPRFQGHRLPTALKCPPQASAPLTSALAATLALDFDP